MGYNIVIEGSSEFSLATNEIILEPESKVEFPVTLLAVFSNPAASAKLTFLGVRNALTGVAAGATMVFQLTSVIIGRKPVEKILRNVPVYDLDPVSVTLVNPFPEEATFAMKLVCQHKPIELDMVVERAVKGLPPRPPSASANLGYSPIPQVPKPVATKVTHLQLMPYILPYQMTHLYFYIYYPLDDPPIFLFLTFSRPF